MFLATLLFAAALQQCGTYNGPADGAIHVCGHAYKLICTRSGSPSDCYAHGAAEVDHFEVRDENGRALFVLSSSVLLVCFFASSFKRKKTQFLEIFSL